MVKRKTDEDDYVPERSYAESIVRKILVGVIIVIMSSWIGYISLRGLTTNENLALVKMDVEVLKASNIVIKDDIKEIKELSRAIRDEQIRRQKIGK